MGGLQGAMKSRDVAQLKINIQMAKEASIDPAMIAQAEGIVKEEEPKMLAREAVEKAVHTVPISLDVLNAAIAQAKAAGLDNSEYKECEDMVKNEGEKVRLFDEVKKIAEETKSVDMTSIDAIAEAKTKL